MFGIDEKIAGLSEGHSLLIVIAVAVLLGLRHATDPDHITAVSTLVASERERGVRLAAGLGLAWGLGHGSSLLVLGLPIVLFESYLPEALQTGAEIAIGIVIMALAVRLLLRWRAGAFHAHAHAHDDEVHRHLHRHERPHDLGAQGHDHDHAPGLGRSPLQAGGVGLLQGVGGSAGVGILLLATIADQVEAAVALTVLAAFTAVSMTLLTTAFGYVLASPSVQVRFGWVAPILGATSLAFGGWYALGGVQALV